MHEGAYWLLTRLRAAKETLIPLDEIEDRLTVREWGDLLAKWQIEADRDEQRQATSGASTRRRLI
jgi:hypothetical protein